MENTNLRRPNNKKSQFQLTKSEFFDAWKKTHVIELSSCYVKHCKNLKEMNIDMPLVEFEVFCKNIFLLFAKEVEHNLN